MAFIASLKSRWRYGWVIFGLTFANLIVEGGVKNVVPVVFVALRDSFQRSALVTSAIFSVGGLVGGLGAPLIGAMLDRMGPRWLFPLGALALLAGYVLSSFATDLWQLFILYSVVLALGESAVSSFTATANLAPWFPRTRGRVLGLADAGNPVGQAIITPLAAALVATLGWRPTFQILGVLFFLLVAPANFRWQRRPPSRQFNPEIAGAANPGSAHPPGGPSTRGDSDARPRPSESPMPMRALLSRPAAWSLILARFIAALANQMTRVHLVAFFIAAGYDELQAATAIGLVGIISLAGRPMSGALSDRFGREALFTVGQGMQIASIVIILVLEGGQMWPLVLFVGLSGLSDGISGIVIGAKAADLFPPRSLGTVLGLVQLGRGVGLLLGPLLAGLLFDLQGDYMTAFSLAAGFTAVSIGCLWAVGLDTGTPATRSR